MQTDSPYIDKNFVTNESFHRQVSHTLAGLSVAVTTLSVSVYGLS